MRRIRKQLRSWKSIKGIQYLDSNDVIFIHVAMVKWNPGERPNVSEIRAVRRDLLDSAVNVIRLDDYYKGVHFKAAALFRSIVKNHAFVDGNKRTGVLATDVFLGINGYNLAADKDELIKFTLKIAKGYVKDLYVIKSWLKKRSKKFDGETAKEFRSIWQKVKDAVWSKK